jgi:predicted phage-related endonuclease
VFVLDDREIYSFPINFDQNYYEKQQEYLVKFWNEYVIKDVEPEYTITDIKKLKNLHDNYLEISDDQFNEISNLVIERQEVNNDLKILENRRNMIEDYLKEIIEKNPGLTYSGIPIISYKLQQRVDIPANELMDESPELYEKLKKETQYRVLRISVKKILNML